MSFRGAVENATTAEISTHAMQMRSHLNFMSDYCEADAKHVNIAAQAISLLGGCYCQAVGAERCSVCVLLVRLFSTELVVAYQGSLLLLLFRLVSFGNAVSGATLNGLSTLPSCNEEAAASRDPEAAALHVQSQKLKSRNQSVVEEAMCQ